MESLLAYKLQVIENLPKLELNLLKEKLSSVRESFPEKCPVWVYLTAGSVTVSYLYIWNKYQYWERRGVKGPKPSFFGMGNSMEQFSTMGTKNSAMKKWAKEYGSIFGIYQMGFMPTIVISDPKIVKDVNIKQFSRFTTRGRTKFNFMFGPLSEHFMTTLEGHAWHRQRTTITPFFSGARLAEMVPILIIAAEKIIEEEISKSEDSVNTKEMTREFSMSAIMASGFSIDARKNPELMKEAIMHGNSVLKSSVSAMMLLMLIPQWIRFKLNIIPFSYKADSFFRTLVKDVCANAVENRQAGQKVRPDFVSLMTENVVTEKEAETASKGFTNDEITSQLFLFILAGMDTTSNVLHLILYALAVYPEFQEELSDIIASEVNGEVNYENLKKIKFLDAIIKETQRFYPTNPFLSRECDETTTINGIPIEKGALVAWDVPLIHMSEEFYDEPEKFNPHRFDGNETNTLKDEHWLAYGSGPRACPAVRWTFVTMKIFLIQILLKYKIVKTEKTLEPDEWGMKIVGASFTTDKPLFVGFQKR